MKELIKNKEELELKISKMLEEFLIKNSIDEFSVRLDTNNIKMINGGNKIVTRVRIEL